MVSIKKAIELQDLNAMDKYILKKLRNFPSIFYKSINFINFKINSNFNNSKLWKLKYIYICI